MFRLKRVGAVVCLLLFLALALASPVLAQRGHGDGACTYQATFITDVTMPDNAVLPDAVPFIKTWRVRNDGACPWGPGYALHSLVFVDGTQLAASDTIELPVVIQPGAVADISIPMTSAIYPGVYRSDWKFQVDGYGPVGVGARGTSSLYVLLQVDSTVGKPGRFPPPVRLQFPTGGTAAQVSGIVAYAQPKVYILRVLAGQRMTVQVTSSNGSANFSLQGVTNGQPLKRMENAERQWTGALPSTQDYLITVGAMAEPVAFNLTVVVEPLGQSNQPQRIQFAAGATSATVTGSVIRGERNRYVLRAQAGQRMQVTVTSAEQNAVFTLHQPNGQAAPGTQEGQDTRRWSGRLPVSGDYIISVGPTRGNATYALVVTIR